MFLYAGTCPRGSQNCWYDDIHLPFTGIQRIGTWPALLDLMLMLYSHMQVQSEVIHPDEMVRFQT